MEFVVDFPVVSWGSIVVETDDFDSAEKLREAIIKGEVDIELSPDKIMSSVPLMDIDNVIDNMGEAPNALEVSE